VKGTGSLQTPPYQRYDLCRTVGLAMSSRPSTTWARPKPMSPWPRFRLPRRSAQPRPVVNAPRPATVQLVLLGFGTNDAPPAIRMANSVLLIPFPLYRGWKELGSGWRILTLWYNCREIPSGLATRGEIGYNTTGQVHELMVGVAQLVRAPGCGPGGRGFKSHRSPQTLLLC
jgi:hypothetical protein